MTSMFHDSVEGVQTFTTIVWTQAAAKSGVLNAKDHMMWVSAEYGANVANREVGLRILIDGVEVSSDYHTCTLAGQYRKFCDYGNYAPTEGLHTISLEVRALTTGVTVNVRRIRLGVMQE